ncbi:MAG TPA: hydantoinase/oxoprolinase family protein [Anaerolineales bacterium]|nr:hydantoinase/oxoprolinase family protein [Anaerolineales bacterium]
MISPETIRVGIDTGGTFTDFVVFPPASGAPYTFKISSTPHNPAAAVLSGLDRIRAVHPGAPLAIVHGSTVATNALLERKGARTALVTTRGFRDVLAIGRQDRPDIYALSPRIPPPLVPGELRFEISERIGSDGEVLIPLEDPALDALVEAVRAVGGVESIAVCTLFSFLRPEHEAAAAARLRALGYPVSVSHEILPEFREYERTSTTVTNAYVGPVLDRYLGAIEGGLAASETLAIMQSNGGTISPGRARREAVRCILSGPAGGVTAAGELHGGGATRLLTIDMGGTSTDVSLVAGGLPVTTEAVLDGLPIGVPVLDIHTIGAGGGSIAAIDPGGGLRVGPESAGADPGPACYGRGAGRPLPTVTDANLVLGRLPPDRFLAGEMPLYPALASAALDPVAVSLGLSLEETAAGIVRIVEAHMARALRVISVERGHDPADFSLVSFGGAGGLHAVELARELGIPRVIVPAHAATFSALGLLLADVVKDYSRTVMLPGDTPMADLVAGLETLTSRARIDLAAEGIPPGDILLKPSLDLRLRGQSYELNVSFTGEWQADFGRQYRETYDFFPEDEPVEIVNLRLQARGFVRKPVFEPEPPGDGNPARARTGDRQIWHDGGFHPIPVYDGARLHPGDTIPGPALLSRPDTTVWLPPASRSKMDRHKNLTIILQAPGTRYQAPGTRPL